MDLETSGWLEGEDVMIALRGVNNKLTEAEEEYLYRVTLQAFVDAYTFRLHFGSHIISFV